jgi:hypothetical protein
MICHVPLWIFGNSISWIPWKNYGGRANGFAVDWRTSVSKSTTARRLGRQWLLYLPVAIAKRFRFVHIQPKAGELDTEHGPVA